MSKQRKRRGLRFSLRTLLIVLTVFCVSLAWLGWRVKRAQQQQRAIGSLKAKGTFLYHQQYDAVGVLMGRLTGSWTPYGDVCQLFLSHDVVKPLQIEFDPQDIELLKNFPHLRVLEIHSRQNEQTITCLAEIASLRFVGLHMNDTNDPGVVKLKQLRPDLEIVTK